jgi:hypothetical protein
MTDQDEDSRQPLETMQHAIRYYQRHGSKHRISWLLRSGLPLTPGDRELLADLIDGKIRLKRGRPPLAHLTNPNPIRMALWFADGLVDMIKAGDIVNGRKGHGAHDRALRQAAESACPPGLDVDEFEAKLHTFRRRPRRQRDPL